MHLKKWKRSVSFFLFFCIFASHTVSLKKGLHILLLTWQHAEQYGFLFLLCMAFCAALRGSPRWVLIGPLVFSGCKREKISIIAGLAFLWVRQIGQVITFYLSPEGLEVMTQSKYSLAAMESSTLFTSLVKLPSTCLLLNASALLYVSDLSMYTGT